MSFKKWRNKLPSAFRMFEAMAVNNSRLRQGQADLVGEKSVSLSMAFLQVEMVEDESGFPGPVVGVVFPSPAPYVAGGLSDGVAKGKFSGAWDEISRCSQSGVFNAASSELSLKPGERALLFQASPDQWALCRDYLVARAQTLRSENDQLFKALTAGG